MTTETSAIAATPGVVFLPVGPDDSPFGWVNPGLGTTLNGPLLSKRIVSVVTALRAELAKAGFSMVDARVRPAQLKNDSLTQAFRLALAGVCDASEDGAPLFQIAVIAEAETVPDESAPNFRVRASALDMDGKHIHLGEQLKGYEFINIWACEFCDGLLSAMAP